MKEKKVKKILIIGGGISGLTAGIFAQKNGFISEIYEKNPIPGGLCMSWKRDGLWIDGCIHWLTGTKEGTQLYEIWKEVDAFDDENIIHDDNFGTIEYEGKKIILYSDLNKLEEELISISKEDTKQIKKLTNLIIKIQNMPLPMDLPLNTMNVFKLIKTGFMMVPYLSAYLYSSSMTCEKYAKKFKSPAIRYMLTHIVPGNNSGLYTTLFAYGTVCVKNGGVPRGGSLAIVKRMSENYKQLGGYINCSSEVDKIIIEKNTAKGIKLKNGKEIYGDYIIPACDAYEILKHLLNDEYMDPQFQKRFNNPAMYPTPTDVYVSFSVNKDKYCALGLGTTYLFKTEPFRIGNTYQSELKLRDYSFDKTFINGDRCLMNILIHQTGYDYPFWEKLYRNKAAYKKEKERIAKMLTKMVEEKFPTLKGEIKVIDIATPITYKRYCNSYHGAYMPFAYIPGNSMLMHNGKIPGLKNLYLAGQWVQMPGGIPLALMGGKFAIQRILKQENRFYKISSSIYQIYKK